MMKLILLASILLVSTEAISEPSALCREAFHNTMEYAQIAESIKKEFLRTGKPDKMVTLRLRETMKEVVRNTDDVLYYCKDLPSEVAVDIKSMNASSKRGLEKLDKLPDSWK